MHPWIAHVISVCNGRNQGDIKAFDADTYGKSFNLERHCFGEFSMANVQANQRMEDQSQVEVASHNALFLGVYDGHGGVHTSSFLVEYLFKNLLKLAQENENTISQDILRNAVSTTEDDFMKYVDTHCDGGIDLGTAGSCCLAGVIWKKTLYIANVGDSRAIIASIVNGKLNVEQLTRDHNCKYEEIRDEVRLQYPDDDEIVMFRNGSWRVKGIIEVSRTIGDAYLKRPPFTFLDRFPRTPPGYTLPNSCVLSAEPEMHSRCLRDTDKFLIFASDGFWDFLSNQRAAEIVLTHPRNGIAKRLLSVALEEAAIKRGVTYKNIRDALLGRDIASRRSFHDDISVIVVYLDRTSFLRKRVPNTAYRGAQRTTLISAFRDSGLTTVVPSPFTPKRLKETFKKRLKSKSSSSPSPLGESSRARDTESLIDQSAPAPLSRWESLKKRIFPNRR